MQPRDRARLGLVGSVLLHAALAGVVASAWRARPESPPPSLGPEVELVWLEDVRPPAVDPVVVSPAPVPEPTATEPAGSESDAGGPPSPVTPRSGKRARGEPSDTAPAPADDVAGSGLALSGLRGSTRPPTGKPGAVLVPRLPPQPTPRPGPPRVAEGPALPLSDDVEPRSLEEAGFKRHKDGSYKLWKLSGVITAKIHPSGRIEFRDRAVTVRGAAVGQAATVSQALAGEEQFKALKAKIVRQTFALRMQMAQSWSRDQMRKQLARLRGQLQRTWTRTELTVTRRREVLFTLWDDCDEAPTESEGAAKTVEATLDQARAEVGTQARAQIVAFIREELPAGSADAYSSAELKRLNASRHSRQRFAPYD